MVIPVRPSDLAGMSDIPVRVNVRKARPCALRSLPGVKVLKPAQTLEVRLSDSSGH